MPTDAEQYGPEFFSALRTSSDRSAQRVVPFLIETTGATSVIDVGCGDGTWLSVFAEHDVEIAGVDGPYIDPGALRIPASAFTAVDLRRPELPDRRYDLACSFEVAEHLPPDVGPALVAALVSAADIVAFGAAIPGQPGTGHINCRWQSEWAALFATHGYWPDLGLRDRFWDDSEVAYWYSQNTIVYRKTHSAAETHLDVAHPDLVRDLVELHTAALQEAVGRQPGLREYLTGLAPAVGATWSTRRRRQRLGAESAQPR